jgi:hypothetical protein
MPEHVCVKLIKFNKYKCFWIQDDEQPFVGGDAHSSGGTGEQRSPRISLRRSVFSDEQRRGLEQRFQLQKYISKPDRKKLAEQLHLKDSQVRLQILCEPSKQAT